MQSWFIGNLHTFSIFTFTGRRPHFILRRTAGKLSDSLMLRISWKRNRTRVFGIGLSRTGTKSLARALRVLGYDVLHWPCSMREVVGHQAVTDITVACRFRELDHNFPGSRFVYTVRDIDSWLVSYRAHWESNKPRRGTPAMPPFSEEAELALYRTLEFDEQRLISAYRKHEENVIKHFEGRPQDLLILNITAGDGWDKLCPFLGKRSPRVPFPHAHKATESANS